ncbi:16113_t:CDS:2, partial [Racocetra fulgida]
ATMRIVGCIKVNQRPQSEMDYVNEAIEVASEDEIGNTNIKNDDSFDERTLY